jgi:topoisomerase-4 subunit A
LGVKPHNNGGGGRGGGGFNTAEPGPYWVAGGGPPRNWADWKDWLGKRAGAGRQGPRGLRKFR